jgi:hypothetical protein
MNFLKKLLLLKGVMKKVLDKLKTKSGLRKYKSLDEIIEKN